MAQLTPYTSAGNSLVIESAIDVNGTIYGLDNTTKGKIRKLDPVTGQISDPIKDAAGSIITSPQYPAKWVNLNGTLVFLGSSTLDPYKGGLWKIDNSGKAVLFESTNNSNASGDRPIQFDNLTNVDGILYFSGNRVAFDQVKYTGTYYGYEIYKLDPATGETTFIEVEPGDKSSNPSNFTNINGTLYFTATTADSGTELWKLDAAGKPQKLEIVAGNASSNPSGFTKFNNNLYFSVLGGTTEAGLYKIDTTTGNPVKIADTNVFEPVVVNGEMYFRTGDFGYDIKKIDASDNITQVPLGTLKTDGSSGAQLTNVNDTLYFITSTVSSQGYFNGTALTKLDASGNPVVFDKMAGIGSGGTVSHLTKIGNELYFVAQETSTSEAEIWKIDVTTGQPVEIGMSPITTNILPQPIGFESNGVVVFPGNGGSLNKLDDGATSANQAPIVANLIADTTATIGTAFSFAVPANSFSDPDAGNTLTYAANLADGNNLPTWLAFDAATRTFTGTPPAGTSNLSLSVRATDNGGLSVTDDFNLSFNSPAPDNQAPVVANAIADQNATIGKAFSFVIPVDTFSDPDVGDTLTYGVIPTNGSFLPTWLAFDAATRTFSGTPPVGTANEVLGIQVLARDKGKLGAIDIFNITISGTPSDPSIQKITSTPAGGASNGDSGNYFIFNSGAISGDGRYVVYGSDASNLVAGDTNNKTDTFLYDRTTNTNQRLGEDDTDAGVSRNGRYVAFFGKNAAGKRVLFVYDTVDRTTSPISSTEDVFGSRPQISDDGRYISLYTGGGVSYVDRSANTVTVVPRIGVGADGYLENPTMSPTGAFFLYSEYDSSSSIRGTYRYDLTAQTSTKISEITGVEFISADGRYAHYEDNWVAKKIDLTDNTVSAGNEELLGVSGGDFNAGNDYYARTSENGRYRVTLARDGANIIAGDTNGFQDLFIGDAGGTNGSSTVIPGLTLTSNLFQTDSSFKGFGITPISQKPTQKVSEIALFAVDDSTGKIGGIAPGEPGYIAAALANAKSICSTLGGDFFSSDKRELSLDPNKIYQAIELVDGSLLDAQKQLANGHTPDNLLFSLPDANGNSSIKITNTPNGYKFSINNDELVLDIAELAGETVNIPIGAKSQNTSEGRIFDLRDYNEESLTTKISTRSDAMYDNQIGFYEVADLSGAIRLDDGSLMSVDDDRYAEEAIKKAVTHAEMITNKNDSQSGLSIEGGEIYAPVVVSNGTFQDFLDNPTERDGVGQVNAYFNYIGANSDQLDHFRLIDDNTFAVEDIYGGGDRDFNDIVVKMDFSI